jgi:hypothetical protein
MCCPKRLHDDDDIKSSFSLVRSWWWDRNFMTLESNFFDPLLLPEDEFVKLLGERIKTKRPSMLQYLSLVIAQKEMLCHDIVLYYTGTVLSKTDDQFFFIRVYFI